MLVTDEAAATTAAAHAIRAGSAKTALSGLVHSNVSTATVTTENASAAKGGPESDVNSSDVQIRHE